MKFDLAQIDTRTLADIGVAMTLRDLDGVPLVNRRGIEMKLVLLGPDSRTFQNEQRKLTNKRLAASPRDAKPRTLEEIVEEGIATLVVCTVGWDAILTADETPSQGAITEGDGFQEAIFSKDECRKLYEAYPVIREQAEAFYTDRRNFLMASSKR